jgi:glycine cleavage system H protein
MYYAKSHEYINFNEETKIGTVGITDTAQQLLGDIVYLELPQVGDDVKQGEDLGTIESVKTADAVVSPVSGCVLAVNELINDEPEILNRSPEDEGWIATMNLYDETELKQLMNKEQYDAWCEEDYAQNH